MTTSFADTPSTTDFDDDAGAWPDVASATGEDPSSAVELPAQRATSSETGDGPHHGNKTGGTPPKQHGRTDNKALIRRAAQKTLEVAAATDDQRRVLAGVLRSSADSVQLAVDVMTAPRGALSVVSDLEDVATSDPMEAGILVASWPKPRVAALWSLLSELGAVGGSRPTNDAKAALALAKAAQSLPTESHDLIESVSELARKS